MESWDIVVSVITAITAICAIIISLTQVQLSNRQFLFERRLKIILLIEDLMALFNSTNFLIESTVRDEPLFASDMISVSLTNNSYLYDMANALKAPLKDTESHRRLLKKIEWFKEKSRECQYVFRKKKWQYLSDFISRYSDFLFSIYQYIICLSSTKKFDSQESVRENKLENQLREEFFRRFDLLSELYKTLDCRLITFLKKQLRI